MGVIRRWWQQFKGFALKGNVLELAVAVIIGGAFQNVVNGLVQFILMPALSYVTPDVKTYESWTLGRLQVGSFLASLINFVLVAGVLFLVIRKIIGTIRKAIDEPDPREPTTKECPYCLSKIPDPASKCAYCTADLPPPPRHPSEPSPRTPKRSRGR